MIIKDSRERASSKILYALSDSSARTCAIRSRLAGGHHET